MNVCYGSPSRPRHGQYQCSIHLLGPRSSEQGVRGEPPGRGMVTAGPSSSARDARRRACTVCKASLELSTWNPHGAKCRGEGRPGAGGSRVWQQAGCRWGPCTALSHLHPPPRISEFCQDFSCLGIQVSSELKFVFRFPSM